MWDTLHIHIHRKFSIPYATIPPLKGTKPNSRDDLAELFSEFDYTVGAEIGVREGIFSEVLLKANPMLKLYCIDPWTPYKEVPSGRKQNRFYNEAKQRLSQYENAIMIKKYSMDALVDIPDGSLDFVYIDANHEQKYVEEDITGWSTKVKSGGIVSGHDYFFHPRRSMGIIPAVDAFVKQNDLVLYLTNEKYPSFFWVKP